MLPFGLFPLLLLWFLFLLLTVCSLNVASSTWKAIPCLFWLESIFLQNSVQVLLFFFLPPPPRFLWLTQEKETPSLCVINMSILCILYDLCHCGLYVHIAFNLVPSSLLLLEPPLPHQHLIKCLVQDWYSSNCYWINIWNDTRRKERL